MDYEKLIEQRQSLRSFERKEVPAAALADLQTYFAKTERILPELGLELHCAAGSGTGLEGIAGYGGNAFSAPLYLLLLSEEKEGWLENAGFVGEQLFLKLIELGLSACWLTLTDGADAKTCEEDRCLSLGATMANFWLVYSKYNANAYRWELGGTAEPEMQLPADYSIAAQLRLF